MQLLDLTTLFTAWSSILLGSFITYYLVQRYEKIKDKVKIKEKLVDEANEMWQSGFQYFGAVYRANEKESIDLLAIYSRHSDYLEGLLLIYSKDDNINHKIVEIKNNYNKKLRNLEEKKKIDFNDTLIFIEEFNFEMRILLRFIRHLKIDFKV